MRPLPSDALPAASRRQCDAGGRVRAVGRAPSAVDGVMGAVAGLRMTGRVQSEVGGAAHEAVVVEPCHPLDRLPGGVAGHDGLAPHVRIAVMQQRLHLGLRQIVAVGGGAAHPLALVVEQLVELVVGRRRRLGARPCEHAHAPGGAAAQDAPVVGGERLRPLLDGRPVGGRVHARHVAAELQVVVRALSRLFVELASVRPACGLVVVPVPVLRHDWPPCPFRGGYADGDGLFGHCPPVRENVRPCDA